METIYASSVEFLFDVQVNGNLLLQSPSEITADTLNTNEVKTNIITPATPNGDIIMQQNGIGNMLDIQLADGIRFPNGGSNLTWYQEFQSSGNQWTGIYGAPIGGEYTIGRVGGFCCVRLPFVTGIATIPGYLSSTISVPAWALPSLTISGSIVILDNAATSVGIFTLDSGTGIITIANSTGGTFSGAGLSGFPNSVCFSYALM